MNPSELLHVIRRTVPSTVRGKINAEFPMSAPPKDWKAKTVWDVGFRIDGGPMHGFLEGFFFKPMSLRFTVVKRLQQKHISFVERKFDLKICDIPRNLYPVHRFLHELARKTGYGWHLFVGGFE